MTGEFNHAEKSYTAAIKTAGKIHDLRQSPTLKPE